MNKETKGIWLGLVGIIIFSMTLPATKIAVPEFGVLPTSFYRATIAGIAALLYVLITKIPFPKKADLLPLGIIAALTLAIMILPTIIRSAEEAILAETKVSQVLYFAKEHVHPLQCIMQEV